MLPGLAVFLHPAETRSIMEACPEGTPTRNSVVPSALPRPAIPTRSRPTHASDSAEGSPSRRGSFQAVEQDPRERLRYLIAAREELPGYDVIERAFRAAIAESDDRAMAVLRPMAPRIRRSRRTQRPELEAWAAYVMGQEAVTEVMAPFERERDELRERYQEENRRQMDRRAEIDVLMHQVAWQAEPIRGSLEPEFAFRQTSTHSSSGYGAESYARRSGESDMVFLASQGFESRMDYDRGTEGRGFDHRGRPTAFRYSDGFHVFVRGVFELLDAEILKLRQDGWTYPSHYFGHDEYFRGSVTEEQRRAWSDEHFRMLGWDPQPGRPGDCCPMTVERMKTIYAERGPLKPSWLIPN